MTTKLEDIIKQFVNEQRISCPETIYQSDRVIENAYEFIHKLIEDVDYWYEDPEDEISEEYLEQLEWEKHREETWIGNYYN